jgi:hypothetical protein
VCTISPEGEEETEQLALNWNRGGEKSSSQISGSPDRQIFANTKAGNSFTITTNTKTEMRGLIKKWSFFIVLVIK